MQLATSYLTVAQFRAMASDNTETLGSYNDTQVADLLTRASGVANGIMKRNLLAQQRVEVIEGSGSNELALGTHPITYVRQIQFVMPGLSGFVLPTSRLLLDGRRGVIVTYAPLELQGIGEFAVFPRGTPFAITYGCGYGYNPTAPPSWSAQDAAGGLVPGQYLIGVTTCTEWGETLPAYRLVTTAGGAIAATLQPVLGAFKYRYFVAPATSTAGSVIVGATALQVTSTTAFPAGSQIIIDAGAATAETVTVQPGGATGTLAVTALTQPHSAGASVALVPTLVGEIPATTFSVTASQGTIASLLPPAGYYAESAPTTDTSGVPTPAEITEATRLLALSSIFEQNNLANRGIASTESGRKRVQWRSTEGNGGRGVPTLWQQAEQILQPKSLSTIF